MKTQTLARIIAVAFFVSSLAVLSAGADHPPPPGFLLLVLFDLIAAWLVYRRVPTYLKWSARKTPWRWWRSLADGALLGMVFTFVITVVNSAPQSGIHPGGGDIAILYAVVACVGAIAAISVYFFGFLLKRLCGGR